MTTILDRIAAERARLNSDAGTLTGIRMAACHVLNDPHLDVPGEGQAWPWTMDEWDRVTKGLSRSDQLVFAAALIVAAIEREDGRS